MNRIPPTRFGFDRVGVPGGDRHAALMNWYATHTNLRFVGGYVTPPGGPAWAGVLGPNWEAGWGVAIFAATPTADDWGTYSGTYNGMPFTLQSPNSNGLLAVLNSPQDVAASAQASVAMWRTAMKALFPGTRRPLVFMDSEDSNVTAPPAKAIAGNPEALATLAKLLVANRIAPAGPAAAVLAPVKDATRRGHGIDVALPWLREAIRAMRRPDADGFALRPALYAHTNLVVGLMEEFPDLVVCEVHYDGSPVGERLGADGNPIKDEKDEDKVPPAHSHLVGDDFYLYPGQFNMMPKPSAPYEKVKIAGGGAFSVWPALLQWVGNNVRPMPNTRAARTIGVTRAEVVVMDYESALVDDPLILAPGPRFAVAADGWLWRVDRIAAAQGGAPRPAIATVSCVNVGQPAAPPPPVLTGATAGATRVLPSGRPRPVILGRRSIVLLLCQDIAQGGIGLAYTERTGASSPLAAPKVAVAPDAAVCVDSPMAVVADGPVARAVTVGRDGHLRVSTVDLSAKAPATWQDTRLAVVGSVAVLPTGGRTWIAAITEDDQHHPTISVAISPPWPPTAVTVLAQARPPVPPLPSTRLGLRAHLNQPVVLYIGADLRLYYQLATPKGWTTPARVTDEVLCPFTTISAVETADGLEVLALREDLTLQLYGLTPGRGGRVLATLMAPSDPIDPQHPSWFGRAPNPYGDLALATLNNRRLLAVNRTTFPPKPAPATPRLPERYGTIAYTAQQINPPGVVIPWTDLP